MFITIFRGVNHVSLTWATRILFTYNNPVSLSSISILLSDLCLYLQTGLFLFNFFSQALICISHPSHVCYVSCPYLPPRIHHPNGVWWRTQFHNKAFIWKKSHKSTFINYHNEISWVSRSINVPSGWQKQTLQFTSHCAILNTPLQESTEEDCDLKRDSNSFVDCLHAQAIEVTSTQPLQGRITSRHLGYDNGSATPDKSTILPGYLCSL
jgi:hypothetical protein